MGEPTFEKVCQELQQASPNKKFRTLPDIFGIERREIYITQWLAFLLDPAQNGHGNAPLNALLECAGYNQETDNWHNVRVYTECMLGKRRIDILIMADDSIIGIENKIDSSETNEQTVDYYKSISSKNFKNEYYIFLKPQNNPAKPKSGEFAVVTYCELRNKLHEKTGGVNTTDERCQWLMKEFIKYVDEVSIMEETFTTRAIKYAECYDEYIKDAETEYKNFLRHIVNRIKDGITGADKNIRVKSIFAGELILIEDLRIDSEHFRFHYEIQAHKSLIKNKEIMLYVHLESYKSSNDDILYLFEKEATKMGLKSDWREDDNNSVCVLEERKFSEICDENGKGIDQTIDEIIKQIKEWQKWTDVALEVSTELAEKYRQGE